MEDFSNRDFTLRHRLFGKEIRAQINVLDQGLHILLVGGDRTHIGAIGYQDGPDRRIWEFPGHKEGVVCEQWLSICCETLKIPVTVSCGIHYDGLLREEIRQVLELTEQMCRECVERIRA